MNKQEQRNGLIQIVSHTIKGTSFVGVRNYENKFNEISNQTFLVGADYKKAKLKDVDKCEQFDLEKHALKSKFDLELLSKAKIKILASLINPSKKQSDAQKNAYEHIGKGVKRHIETGEVYVYGFSCKKQVLVEGEYPVTNKRPLTLAQNELKKEMNLSSAKYKQFKVGNATDVNMRGFSL